MRHETIARVARDDAPKGDVLAAARIAGIVAAKRTPRLVPLCHGIALTHVSVSLDVDEPSATIRVTAAAEAVDRTGVEMEADGAVSAACLTDLRHAQGDRSRDGDLRHQAPREERRPVRADFQRSAP